MKIETNIKPRRNGTVNVVTPGGRVIVFSAQDGRLTADVADSADVQFLLGMSDFLPADEDDFAMASALIRGADVPDGAGDDLLDDDGDENAAPVETATALKPGKYTKKSK